MTISTPEAGPFDLVLTRNLKAPRQLVWRAWTEPALIRQWFCPRPWSVSRCVVDLQPGGLFHTTMNGPDGEVVPNDGLWLDVQPGERLVFSNVMVAGWRPAVVASGVPAFTGIITLRDSADGGTSYSALVLHGNQADCDLHDKMGFHQGWGAATDQLDAFAGSLA